MGVADTVSRRDFLGLSAATGASLTLEKLVRAAPVIQIPAEFLATLNALSMLQDKREKVPDDKSIKDAENEVQKLFKDEYRAKKPEFVDTLLDAASKEKGALRFVVLRDAAQLASDNFKLSNASNAIEQLAENYQVKLDGVVNESLKSARKGIKAPVNVAEFAEFGLKLADVGIKWNDYDAAVRAATEAKSVAPKTGDKSLLDRANEKLKEASLLKKEYDEFVRAELRLSGMKPEDWADAGKRIELEKASLAVGKWCCFKEDKWNIGMYALRTSSDKDLADIAQKEIRLFETKVPLNAENFYDLAEAWYAKSQKKDNDSRDKARYSGRALHWYEESDKTAEGLLKAKVQKRISELGAVAGGNIVDLLKMIDVKKDVVAGKWEWKDGKLVISNSKLEGMNAPRIEIPVTKLPKEYDFCIEFTYLDGEGLIAQIPSYSGNQFCWIMGRLGELFALESIAGMGTSNTKNPTHRKAAWQRGRHKSVVQVRENEIRAYVDDVLMAQWKTDYSDIGIFPQWKLRDSTYLGIGTYETSAIFHKIELLKK